MDYTDKNGDDVHIGDHVIPDDGRELVIIGEAAGEVNGLLGSQVDDPSMVSLLTQLDLSRQWTLDADGS